MRGSIEKFKDDNAALEGKVFTIGSDQATRYDKTMKSGYIAEKFYHRVTTSIKHKDKAIAKKLIVKPTALMRPDAVDLTKQVLNKDGEDFIEYQLKLKIYRP